MKRPAAALITVLSTCAVLSADNWPAWRGSNDAGVSLEKNLPVTWSDRQNVAWQAPLRGMGVSTPVVWGDRVKHPALGRSTRDTFAEVAAARLSVCEFRF